MFELLRVRSKLVRSKLKLHAILKTERYHIPLQKIAKLLYLKQRAVETQNGVSSDQLGNQCARCGQLFHASPLGNILVLCSRLIDDHIHPGQIGQRLLYFRTNILPIETAVSCSERR